MIDYYKEKTPKLYWYQINEKSATENYFEQKKAILEKLLNSEEAEESIIININGKVVKK